MPPITEAEQLQQLRQDFDKLTDTVDKLTVKIDMLVIALRGNTDFNPTDTGLFGKVKWLTGEVLTMKRQRARQAGMIAGGIAVGTLASTLIGFLINHFSK